MKLKQITQAGLLAIALASTAAQAHEGETHQIMSAVNMMHCDLILINVDTDELVVTPLRHTGSWPDVICQHSWITPDKSKIFISTDANAAEGTKVAALRLDMVDWAQRTAHVSLESMVPMGNAGELSTIPVPTQTSPEQPIPPVPSAWFPTYAQIHGPTLLPGTDFTYLTGYTNSNIYVLNNKTNQIVRKQSFGNDSRQLHGIYFNPSGRIGLSAPYQFDLNQVKVYVPNRNTGALFQVGSITLGTRNQYAAFSHFTTWVNDRYAFIGTMQAGPTSQTPAGASLIGPSVWRLDVARMQATRVLGPTTSVDGVGVYRPASDVAVVGNTLIVAEEDTLDGNVGPGYIAFFDISELNAPKLLQRLKPGVELPADFKVAHVISLTGDKRFAYVSSYYSNHIVKIDVASRQVTKVFSSADGLDMPHGEFISGNLR